MKRVSILGIALSSLFLISCEQYVYESTNKLSCMDGYERVEVYITDLTTNQSTQLELKDDYSFETGKTYRGDYLFECFGYLNAADSEFTSYSSQQFSGNLELYSNRKSFPLRPVFVSSEVISNRINFYWDFVGCDDHTNARALAFASTDSATLFNDENKVYTSYRQASVDYTDSKIYFGVMLYLGSEEHKDAYTYSTIWNSEM